jgi:hypothetical protein
LNIVTNSLLQALDDPDLARWVEVWDGLEALVVHIYKAGTFDGAQDVSLRQARRWLRRTYPRWEAEFGPHWHGLKAGGNPLAEDPFREVMDTPNAEALVGNWRTMQLLPSAREALNLYIQSRLEAIHAGDSPNPSQAAGPP